MFGKHDARTQADRSVNAAYELAGDQLPNWTYSDMLSGLEHFIGTLPNLAAGSDGSGASESTHQTQLSGPDATVAGASAQSDKEKRRQQKNKLAQKKFRDRQKARSEDLEAQVKATSLQLEDMKRKQKALEARNSMLEKLMDLNTKQDSGGMTPAAVAEVQNLGTALGFSTLPGPLAEKIVQGPNLKLTLPAIKQQVIPIRDFAKLSLPAYAELHTAYILQLAQCIAMLEQDSASPVLQQMQIWGLECGMLLVATSFTSPRMHRDLHHCKMDDVQVVPGDHPSSFFKSLLVVVNLEDRQVQDLLYLRQLFYCKLGQLARQRQAFLHQLTSSHCDSSHPFDRASELLEPAEALRRNAVEEYRTVMQFAAAMYLGIYTSQQWTVTLVYSYPWITLPTSVMEAIAAERGGEPSSETFESDTSIADAQHAANWEDIVSYTTTIDMETVHVYWPLLPQ